MPPRPYVLLSCATSADGYLDDASPRRLILSGPADLDRVDEVRAGCDAILVGAQTVRKDNPRLLIRDPRRSARRAARGLPGHPARVTLTATGDLDPRARFFAPGALRLVYCATPAIGRARARLGDSAVLIDAGDPLSLDLVLTDLAERGVLRVLVEGGAPRPGRVPGPRSRRRAQPRRWPRSSSPTPRAPRLNLPRLGPDARLRSDRRPSASRSQYHREPQFPQPHDSRRSAAGRRDRAAALPARARRPGSPVPALGGGAVPAVPAVGLRLFRRGGHRRRGRRGAGHRVLPRAGGPRSRRGGGAPQAGTGQAWARPTRGCGTPPSTARWCPAAPARRAR